MLYNKIKKIAKDKKIAIRKIEEDCGFAKGSICKWNKVSPAFDKVVCVAKCLGIPISELAEVKEECE